MKLSVFSKLYDYFYSSIRSSHTFQMTLFGGFRLSAFCAYLFIMKDNNEMSKESNIPIAMEISSRRNAAIEIERREYFSMSWKEAVANSLLERRKLGINKTIYAT